MSLLVALLLASLCSAELCVKRRQTPLLAMKERRYDQMCKLKEETFNESKRKELYAMGWQGIWYIIQPDYSCEDVIFVGHHFGDGGKYICNVHWIRHRPEGRPCVYYSFGVNGEINFERELVHVLPGCDMHAFDPTPTVVGGASVWELENMNINYHPWGLSDTDSTIRLEATDVTALTLDTIRARLGHTGAPIDVLKIDIEGHEWAVFEQQLSHCDREKPFAHQILVELHMFGEAPYTKTLGLFMDDMRNCGYRVFAKDPNHMCAGCMEYGFVHENFIRCK